MKTAKMTFWARTKSDRIDEASAIVSIDVPQSEVLNAARIFEHGGWCIAHDADSEDVGECGCEERATPWLNAAKAAAAGNRLPCGHGVLITYASGKTRTVRAAL